MENPETLPTLGTQDTGRRIEKIKGAIKIGQSRDTGNIGCTCHRKKTSNTRVTTQKAKKDEQHRPYQKPRVNPGTSEV